MSVWSNRILIFLGTLGIFITGVLSYTTWKELSPPCGGNAGCTIVQQSIFSKVGDVSVSYIGLIGYVVLLLIALMRASTTGRLHRKLSVLGFASAALGTVYSLYLTYIALAVIGQKCIWCLSSLAVIILTTIVHAALLQADPPERSDASIAGIGAFILLSGAVGGVFATVANLKDAIKIAGEDLDVNALTLEELIPIDAKTLGDKDAPITIVEFADVNCPSCREMHPKIKQLISKYDGRIRLAFHHFPLIGIEHHQTSASAAAIGEYAADKGMFWQYIDEVMRGSNAQRIGEMGGLIAVAGESGLNTGDVLTIFQSKEPEHTVIADGYWARVDADFKLGEKMLVRSTPTFIVFAEGLSPEHVASHDLESVFDQPKYQRLLKRP